MKEKTWRVTSAVIAWGMVLLILIIVFGAMYMFIGNPASWFVAKNSALNYIEENYPDESYEMFNYGFDFMGPYYYADFEHTQKPDNKFTIYMDYRGNVKFSTYDNIKDGWNTAYRLTDEYGELFAEIYMSEDFSFEVLSGESDLALIYDEIKIQGQTERTELIPNKEYDIKK